VNSINCIICVGDGVKGVGEWLGIPNTLSMSGLSLAWHWQFVCGHVYFISHSGTVFSWFILWRLPAFVNV
jgi:hypothetical protein